MNTGLVGYWTFDAPDTSFVSNTVTDKSGSGNTGTMISMATSTSRVLGKLGQALSFDGVAKYISLPNLDRQAPLSIAFWTKRGRTGQASDNIIGGSCGSWGIGFNANNTLFLTNTCVNVANSTGTIADTTKWHHVVVTYDGSNARFYFDGALDSSPVYASGTFNSSAVAYTIGRVNVTAYYKGSLDDVRVYSKVLSQREVTTLYTLGQETIQKSQNNKVTSGLTHLWTFDGADLNTITKTVYDRAGTTNGTIVALATSTQLVNGALGQAFNFNGTSQYASLADINTALNPPASIALWIKRGQTSAAADEGIIGYSGSGCTGQNVWGVGIASGANANKPFLTEVGIGAQYPTGTITDRNWHHLVLTLDGTNIRFYIDGVLDSTVANATTFTCVASSAFAIGTVNTSGWYKGAVDDIRMYNRVLSANEVKSLYSIGKSTIQKSQNTKVNTGLVGLWSFDGADMTSTVATDRSGNGYNGTLTNMTLKNVVTPGKIGQALQFQGGSAYILTANDIMSNPTGLTIAFWMKSATIPASTQRVFSVEGAYVITLTTAGKLQGIVDGAEAEYAQTSVISDNKWHHVAFTHNGAIAGGRIYVDGVASSTFTGSSYSGFYNINSLTRPVAIGGNVSPNPISPFIGSLDDVRLYNRVITNAEITRLYSIGK
ncbi:MAG: LamG domain-containing protein [bacterium]